MSRVYLRRIGLVVAAVTAWLCSNTAGGEAENEVLKRLTDAVKEYSDTAKEQQKIDKFHIEFALRRAVRAERPGIPFRWNNLHTNHKGEIVLLDFIGPRGNGRLCVDFKHTYYLGGASPIEDEGTVCQNSEGEWDDIIVRAVFKGTGTTNQTVAIPPYGIKIVREVQTLLDRLSYNPGPVDGIYGQRTRRAIEYYQRDEGLSITGEVSEELVASLNESLAALEGLPSTGEPGKENNLNSVSTASAPADRIPQPTGLDSSHADKDSNQTSLDERGNDKAAVTAPVQTVGTGESLIAAPVKTNPPPINTTDIASAASDPENAEATASSEKPSLHTIDDVDDLIAQAPTTPKTKVQTEIQGSTQIGERENWLMALIGLVFCGVVGLIASRYLSSERHSSTVRQPEMERAAAELDNKIAIVVGQADKGLDKAPKLDRDATASVGVEGVKSLQRQIDENKAQHVVVESDRQQVELKPHDQVISEPMLDETPLKEVGEGTMESQKDTPVQQQKGEEDSKTDSQDIIIQAITEFDELIKETEHVLAMDLELNSRENITKAIEQATKLIKKAFEKDPIEGDSHKYTQKAIREATKLIEEVLEEYSTATSQLRVKNK